MSKFWSMDELEYHKCPIEFSIPEDMDGSLGVYPGDAEIYKIEGDWFLGVNEYYMPISHCPFCGTQLD